MARTSREESIDRGKNKKDNKAKKSNVVDKFMSLRSQLAALGLTLRDIPGDGNCLFRALGDQLEGHPRNHLKHRRSVVQYMREHRKDFEPFVEDDIPFERHLANLSEDGTHAGNDVIVAFSRLHHVIIVIHQLNYPIWQVSGINSSSQHHHNCRQLHIAYHNGDHYSSVRLIGDKSDVPASVQLSFGHSPTSGQKITHKASVPVAPATTLSTPIHNGLNGSCENDIVEVVLTDSDDQEVESSPHSKDGQTDLILPALLDEENVTKNAHHHESPIWSRNGTGTRIFGDVPSQADDTSQFGGARPKVISQDKKKKKLQTQQHITRRQKQELKKRLRKQENMNRKKEKSSISSSSSSLDSMGGLSVGLECSSISVPDLECLSI